VRSSQANLAATVAGIEAAEAFGRAFTMMMTRPAPLRRQKCRMASELPACRRSRRRAARAVRQRDGLRPARKSQVESLGAKFLAVEGTKSSRKRPGPPAATPRKMSKGVSGQAGRGSPAEHLKKQDIVITTGRDPGRPGAETRQRRDVSR